MDFYDPDHCQVKLVALNARNCPIRPTSDIPGAEKKPVQSARLFVLAGKKPVSIVQLAYSGASTSLSAGSAWTRLGELAMARYTVS